jgi:ERCC4-type nuclease
MNSIIIDTRESKYEIEVMFDAQDEFTILHKKLEVGDISYKNCCIERKTPSDFVSSIRRSIFWDNMIALKENYKIPLIWIDGSCEDWNRIFARIRIDAYNSVVGAKAALNMMNIPICEFSKVSEATHFFLTVFRKMSDDKLYQTPLEIKKRGRSLTEMRLKSIACIPTIGMKGALNLLKDYGTIEKMIEESKNIDTKIMEKVKKFYFE